MWIRIERGSGEYEELMNVTAIEQHPENERLITITCDKDVAHYFVESIESITLFEVNIPS